MGDFDYDTKGHGYARLRRADPRIAAYINDAIGAAPTVLNVGAGAGSYEPAGRTVIAVEPSATMRAQRAPGAAPAIAAIAEALPFADHAFAASMALVTVHQWPDAARGLAELRRVSAGPAIVLTFDRDHFAEYWLADYVPELMAHEERRFPAIDAIRSALGGQTSVLDIPIPNDCTDGFNEAYYARPEAFLDPQVRRAQSAWTFVGETAEERFVQELRGDLESGAWDRRYGEWRRMPFYNGSLRLIVRAAL